MAESRANRTIDDHVIITPSDRLKMVVRGSGNSFHENNAEDNQPTSCVEPPLEMSISERKTGLPEQIQPNIEGEAANVSVEFDICEVLCTEAAVVVDVPLRRKGDTTRWLECEWVVRDEDNCSIAPNRFKIMTKRGGTVRFEAGSAETTITLDVPQDPTWNVEGMYKCRLLPNFKTEDPQEQKPVLGSNREVSLYSINLVPFPAGVKEGETNAFKLVKGFVMHNYTEIPHETKVALALGLVPALTTIATSLFKASLINNLAPAIADNEAYWFQVVPFPNTLPVLYINACGIFAAFLLDLLAQRFKVRLRLGGKATKALRTNMFSTLLQLSETSRDLFDDGDVAKALDTAAEEATGEVWLNFFTIFEKFFVLCGQLIITFVIVAEIHGLATIILSVSVPLMVVLAVLLVLSRWSATAAVSAAAVTAAENWSAFVTMAEGCTPAILGYKQGWVMTKKFNGVHANFNRLNAKAVDFQKATMWYLQIGFNALTLLVVIIAGMQARTGEVKIGDFSVLVSAVKGVGKSLESVSTIAISMLAGSAEVGDIAYILNQETRREALLMSLPEGDPNYKLRFLGWHSADASLVLRQVEYKYAYSAKAAVPQLSLEIPNEALVCFTQKGERRRCGMDTLFKVLSGQYLPTSGRVEIQSRFRVIYVPLQPILFDGSLGYNLQFGRTDEVDMDDVWKTCANMGLSSELVGHADFDIGRAGDTLRNSDRVLISITRAMIFGVDVMLISSTIDALGPHKAVKVLRECRRYVEKRGHFEKEDAGLHRDLKKRKTVIYTSKIASLWEEADYLVDEAPSDLTQGPSFLDESAVKDEERMQPLEDLMERQASDLVPAEVDIDTTLVVGI